MCEHACKIDNKMIIHYCDKKKTTNTVHKLKQHYYCLMHSIKQYVPLRQKNVLRVNEINWKKNAKCYEAVILLFFFLYHNHINATHILSGHVSKCKFEGTDRHKY